MSTQNENLLVKLIKKSVGLPAGKSACCGASMGQSNNCCGANGSSDCCGAETSDALQSSGCDCGDSGCGGDCCDAEGSDELRSGWSPLAPPARAGVTPSHTEEKVESAQEK